MGGGAGDFSSVHSYVDLWWAVKWGRSVWMLVNVLCFHESYSCVCGFFLFVLCVFFFSPMDESIPNSSVALDASNYWLGCNITEVLLPQ